MATTMNASSEQHCLCHTCLNTLFVSNNKKIIVCSIVCLLLLLRDANPGTVTVGSQIQLLECMQFYDRERLLKARNIMVPENCIILYWVVSEETELQQTLMMQLNSNVPSMFHLI